MEILKSFSLLPSSLANKAWAIFLVILLAKFVNNFTIENKQIFQDNLKVSPFCQVCLQRELQIIFEFVTKNHFAIF